MNRNCDPAAYCGSDGVERKYLEAVHTGHGGGTQLHWQQAVGVPEKIVKKAFITS